MHAHRVKFIDVPGFSNDVVAAVIRATPGVSLVGRDPDTVVVDDRRFADALPYMHGGVPTIVLGADDDPAFAARARRHGAIGWMLKESVDPDLPRLLQSEPDEPGA
jgi:hypothetical protein